VIDMRYENPYYMVEDAGSADLIAGGRLQLGISRGSPEQVIEGWRHFGYAPAKGESDADMGRRNGEIFFELLKGQGLAEPSPRPMFPNPPGLCVSNLSRKDYAIGSEAPERTRYPATRYARAVRIAAAEGMPSLPLPHRPSLPIPHRRQREEQRPPRMKTALRRRVRGCKGERQH
jgi:alkanesulfonate monooxygenase SsuD/methylene tetrahydromethanopterin reductase-like flavin-dependent oxidoreductase (luciferase family)